MDQLWHRPIKILIQQLMFRHRVQPLFAAQNVCNSHQMIVHHDGQMIGRHTVGFYQHLHIDLRVGDTDFAPQTIRKRAFSLCWHPHTNHMCLACSHARGYLIGA